MLPTSEIVGRPMMARACGCLQEFQQYAVDKYRAQRLAKFQKTRCAACVEKLNEEQKQAAAALPSKGEALQLLPTGTEVSMTRRPDGSWSGTLTAGGTTIEAIGDGPQGVVVTLARQWVATTGVKPAEAKPAAAKPAVAAKPSSPASAPRPAPRR